MYFTGIIPHPLGVRAEATADNTSIRVSWEWSSQDELACLDSVIINYQPEGGSLMNYPLDSATATSTILSNLQCNTQYTISVLARGGVLSNITMAYLPARGM